MTTSLPSRLILSFVLVNILLLTDCHGKQVGKRRDRRALRSEGPNMCKIQIVHGTNNKYFTHCIADHLKLICERPTYERWECCPGFTRRSREPGCPVEKPLDNILVTARDLRLDKFLSIAEKKSEINTDLSKYGPWTVFIPSDEAMAEAPQSLIAALSDSKESLPLVHYHIAPGRLNLSVFRDRDLEFVTMHGGSKIRVNKYAYGVATVNCARIIRPDELATNGIVHVIDKVISPLDVEKTVVERIKSDKRFSQFYLAMMVADMAKKLQAANKSFTVLAPTDQAFAKLPEDLLNSILSDADTAEKVLKRHIVRGVFCADAIVVSVGIKTMDDSRLLFRCKRDGLMINDAKVLYPDIVASNGVVHGIDTVILPDSVKSTADLLKEMFMDQFLELLQSSGMNETSEDGNCTIFAPTNEAFKALAKGYLKGLCKKDLENLLKYHIVPGRITEEDLIGGKKIPTLTPFDILVKINRKDKTLDKAKLIPGERECKGSIIHKINKVLEPKTNSIFDELSKDKDMSVFTELLHESGMGEQLLPTGSYTVIAPTNRAFANIDDRDLEKIKNNPHRLKKFIQRHIINTSVLKCMIPEQGIYSVRSEQTDMTEFQFNQKNRKLHINKHAVVISDDILTTNGVLYKVDHVLPCQCETSLRTNDGIHIFSQRYRRRY